MAAATVSPTGVRSISTVFILMGVYSDANKLYEGGKKAIAGAPWKYSSQNFEMNQLLNTAHLQKDIEERTYYPGEGQHFWINERGKHRLVTSIPCMDKTVNHVLCDEVLSPLLDPYLIHDNGASRIGKGVAFCRRRFEQHIHEYYRKHGNKGFILLGDFKSYYASINAAKAREMMLDLLSRRLSEDDLIETEWLLYTILGSGTGINIGGQVSQNVGITFAHRVDDYVKTVCGQRYYARYSDDFYLINESCEKLLEIADGIRLEARKADLTVHPHKTHIAPIDKPFRFLQISYQITDTGKLVRRINPKSVTRERNRLKGYRRLMDRERMTEKDVEDAFKSWLTLNYKVMSMQQIRNLYTLYKELFGREITWKNSRLRYLTGQSLRISPSTATTT